MIRKELVEKLELVSHALAQTDIIPIFKCFAFTGQSVIAYDDALAIVAPCKTQEKFCVNGQVLLGLLSNSHSETVDFAIDGMDLTVKTGKSVFKLPWFPIEDFLFKEPKDTKPRGAVDENLLAGLSACLLTASKDQSQAALMGVCLTKALTLYSTDGDAITRFGAAAPSGTRYMLPSSFCDTLVKLGQPGELSSNEEWAKAELDDGTLIFGRLLVVDNPIDYEKWIKDTIKEKLEYVAMPKGLDSALSRARVIADPESAKTVLSIANGKMTLLTQTSMGVVKDAVLYGGKRNVEANVSAELMQRCASLCGEVTVFPNCCVFRNGNELFILTSNLG